MDHVLTNGVGREHIFSLVIQPLAVWLQQKQQAAFVSYRLQQRAVVCSHLEQWSLGERTEEPSHEEKNCKDWGKTKKGRKESDSQPDTTGH